MKRYSLDNSLSVSLLFLSFFFFLLLSILSPCLLLPCKNAKCRCNYSEEPRRWVAYNRESFCRWGREYENREKLRKNIVKNFSSLFLLPRKIDNDTLYIIYIYILNNWFIQISLIGNLSEQLIIEILRSFYQLVKRNMKARRRVEVEREILFVVVRIYY